MAIAAFVTVNRHRVVGWMTADTEGYVKDMAQAGGGVIDMEMDCRRRLVKMTVQAVDIGVVGIFNDHLHRGAGGCQRVDVTAGVMAGGATTEMGGQDIWPVLD